MIFARSHADLHNIRLGVDRISQISDRIIGIGPIGVGLDGLLAAVPGLGVFYSVIAGGMLVFEGLRARASTGTLIQIAAYLAVDTLLDVPAGPLAAIADTLFTGHKWSANLLKKHMDETIYIEGTRDQVRNRPEYADLMARVRAGKETRRIVFLG